MATLISAGGNGWRRRCDSRCHEAKGRECHCVCGGRFHGASNGYDVGEEFERAACEALEDGLPLSARLVEELKPQGATDVKLAPVQLRLLGETGQEADSV